MNEARRRKAEKLFQRVVDLPPDRRTSYLQECDLEADVCADVEALLVNSEDNRFASLRTVELLDEEDAELIGKHIGPYKLVELIGEGGFGVVYAAEQEEPVRRRVALKIIRLGMDTRHVVARFEAERQALALMEHPSIATVFDGGATDAGRPYFVMELVRGIPITEYCDANRVSTRQRLELFVQVCRAVQHAHQKGIIHRDIKPSNVLVTLHDGALLPKIIDFGIAKAMNEPLTDKTLFTNLRQFMGTPEYVSPEQSEMCGLDIDTRSDIYSLGVLVYELLTGTTPFNSKTSCKAGQSDILRAIREQSPLTPSRRLSTMGADLARVASCRQADPRNLSRLVHGDLDWIVMKALEKDRTRRYESAAALALDVERHLNNEPVSAGPPSALYRLGKMVSRHKAACGFLAAILALIIWFGVWMSLVCARAEQARSVAEANLLRAHEAETWAKAEVDFMHELLASVDPDRALGREVTVRYVLDEASKRIDEGWLEEHPAVKAAIQLTIGRTYYSLGLFSPAERHIRAAEEAYKVTLGPEHPDTLRSGCELARAFDALGRRSDAETLLRSVLERQKRVLGDEHADTLDSMDALGGILCWVPGGRREAKQLRHDALEIRIRVLGEEHLDTVRSVFALGSLHMLEDELPEAETLLRRSLEARRRLLGDEHPHTAKVSHNLGMVFERRGNYADAEGLYREALKVNRHVLGANHPHTRIALQNLIRVLHAQGKSEEVRTYAIQHVENLRQLVERPDAHPDLLHAYAWMMLTCEVFELRDPDAALDAAKRAVELTEGKGPYMLNVLARAYEMTGDIDKAVEVQRRAVALGTPPEVGDLSVFEFPLIEYLWKSGDPAGAADYYRDRLCEHLGVEEVDEHVIADSLYSDAQEHIDARDYSEAVVLLRMCLTLRVRNLPDDHVLIGETESLLGSALLGNASWLRDPEEFDDAERVLLSAYRNVTSVADVDPLDVRQTIERIIAVYQARDDAEVAAKWRAKLSLDDGM
ncbi:MAG: serine/threonine protein kinase [Phycisphaerales bacterium]|nr:MAG: serine/threonine protein kinase [Phycisphaerales bacterium]